MTSTRITRRRALALLAGVAALIAASAVMVGAQEASDRALGENLFPPELVMKYQQKIGLRQEQRATITQALQQLQNRVVELQWRMQDEGQRLAELLQGDTVNETEVLAQVDRVLSVEREIKRAHIGMLVRIKNTLTADQQKTLKSMRSTMGGAG